MTRIILQTMERLKHTYTQVDILKIIFFTFYFSTLALIISYFVDKDRTHITICWGRIKGELKELSLIIPTMEDKSCQKKKEEPNPMNNKQKTEKPGWIYACEKLKPRAACSLQSWLLTCGVIRGLPPVLRRGVQLGFGGAVLDGKTGVDGVVIHRVAIHRDQQALQGREGRGTPVMPLLFSVWTYSPLPLRYGITQPSRTDG